MAKKSGSEKSIADIRQEIADSRERMTRDLGGLRYELDFPLKFRRSFQRNTALWISAAVMTGVVLTARATTWKKPPKVKVVDSGKAKGEQQRRSLVEAGLVTAAVKFAATLLRPIVVGFVKKAVSDYTARVR